MGNNFDQSVNWSDDEIGSTEKLNQMVENDNIVYNLVPHYLYRVGETGVTTDFNDSQSRVLKPTVFVGRVYFDLVGKYGGAKTVSFPAGTFAPGCSPVVSCTVAGTGQANKAICTISSTDNDRNVKNDGFRAQVFHRDGQQFRTGVHVHYMVFGWQEA